MGHHALHDSHGAQFRDAGSLTAQSISLNPNQATVHALRVGVATELMVPPLPPQQPAEVPSLPLGGCIFPSDHYPVFADVQLVPRR